MAYGKFCNNIDYYYSSHIKLPKIHSTVFCVVSFCLKHKSLTLSYYKYETTGPMTWFCLLSFSGCKVESVYLGVDSVDTQRDRPEVGIPGSTQKCLSADDNSNPLQGWFTSLRNPSDSSVTRDPIWKMSLLLCDFLWWFLELHIVRLPSYSVCITEQSVHLILLHRECKCFTHGRGSRVQSPSTRQQSGQLWHHLPLTLLPPFLFLHCPESTTHSNFRKLTKKPKTWTNEENISINNQIQKLCKSYRTQHTS